MAGLAELFLFIIFWILYALYHICGLIFFLLNVLIYRPIVIAWLGNRGERFTHKVSDILLACPQVWPGGLFIVPTRVPDEMGGGVTVHFCLSTEQVRLDDYPDAIMSQTFSAQPEIEILSNRNGTEITIKHFGKKHWILTRYLDRATSVEKNIEDLKRFAEGFFEREINEELS